MSFPLQRGIFAFEISISNRYLYRLRYFSHGYPVFNLHQLTNRPNRPPSRTPSESSIMSGRWPGNNPPSGGYTPPNYPGGYAPSRNIRTSAYYQPANAQPSAPPPPRLIVDWGPVDFTQDSTIRNLIAAKAKAALEKLGYTGLFFIL